MSSQLLPQAFWFRFAASCPRIEGIPHGDSSGALLDLPEASALPDLAALDGKDAWASVRTAWNAGGLGIAILARGVGANLQAPNRSLGFATVDLWIDTRDTRNVSRATRYCHRFQTRLTLGRDRKTLGAEVEQRPIARALADAPLTPSNQINARARLEKTGWLLELFLPAHALHGFDPETNSRLGFAYQIADHEREDLFLGIGREFSVGDNPSLWSTLELQP